MGVQFLVSMHTGSFTVITHSIMVAVFITNPALVMMVAVTITTRTSHYPGGRVLNTHAYIVYVCLSVSDITQCLHSTSTVFTFTSVAETADMPSDPHLEGQTRILANQPTFSYSKFVLALME